MYLDKLNRIEPKTYSQIYEYVLGVLASILVFRQVATIAIILFVIFNIVFFSRLRLTKKKWISIGIISIPLLLDLLFLFNNESILEGIKNGEKHLTTLLFPLLIIGQNWRISLQKVLRIYSFLFTAILSLSLIRHIVLFAEKFEKYLTGFEVWRMGYQFAQSMDLHAPALNMHVAFLVVVNFYLLLSGSLKKQKWGPILSRLLLFVISLIILLIINTRLAVLNTCLGILLILAIYFTNAISRKKLVAISISAIVIIGLLTFTFVKIFPYTIKKYTDVTFSNMDKIGQLDDIENPEAEIYSSLVTRISIWLTAWETAKEHPFIGVGAADSRRVLIQAYRDTDQQFLAKYEFPVHNQYLDYFLKFGILGLIGCLVYIFHILWIGWKSRSAVAIFFFVLFLTSNITDDFLIRFDGITFSALWISVFSGIYWNSNARKDL